ncbi:MAG: response regulator [Gammaproteobacteria bacterium]
MATILYIEDNDDNAYMLSRRLARAGYAVQVAGDGERGLDLAHESLPDLILMDLSLPGLDGWEAARRLKANERTAAVPIIAVSSHAMSGDRERALAAGCDDYDIKPVDFPRLLEKIRVLLPDAGADT